MADSLTEEVLKEVALLVEGGGAGGGSRGPTKTVFYKGPQTSGVLASYRLDFSGFLVWMGTQTTAALVTRGRTWTSLGSSTWHEYSVIGMPCQFSPWQGREKVSSGDTIYFDTLGGMGTSDALTLVFEVL